MVKRDCSTFRTCLWTRGNSCSSFPLQSFYHSFFCQNHRNL